MSAGWFQETDSCLGKRGLPAARFADQPQPLSLLNRQADTVHRFNRSHRSSENTTDYREVFLQFPYIH